MQREDYQYGDPCPECGHSGHFHETCEAHGVTHFDSNGSVIDFESQLFDNPLYVECPECNTVLMDKLPGDRESVEVDERGDYLNIKHDGNIRVSISEENNEVLVYEDGIDEPIYKTDLNTGEPTY